MYEIYKMPEHIKKAVNNGYLKTKVFIDYLVTEGIAKTEKPIDQTALKDCIFKGYEDRRIIKGYFDTWSGCDFIAVFE